MRPPRPTPPPVIDHPRRNQLYRVLEPSSCLGSLLTGNRAEINRDRSFVRAGGRAARSKMAALRRHFRFERRRRYDANLAACLLRMRGCCSAVVESAIKRQADAIDDRNSTRPSSAGWPTAGTNRPVPSRQSLPARERVAPYQSIGWQQRVGSARPNRISAKTGFSSSTTSACEMPPTRQSEAAAAAAAAAVGSL